MRRPAALLLCVFMCLSVGSAVGQALPGPAALPGEVANTARRIAAADKLRAQERWGEAAEEYQRILSEAGDDLVAVTPRHAVRARWLCQSRLGTLPAEYLRPYRDRIDTQARKWFEQGAAQRNARLLRRVVEEAFCSRYGERALDLLGDLAFERGRFEEADHWWGMIVPPARPVAKLKKEARNPAFPALLFPDPQLDPARVRAKQLLARLFSGEAQGHRARMDEALQAFRSQHGKSIGSLAGQQGLYADILQAVLAEPLGRDHTEETASWPTFGGDAGRGAVVSGAKWRLRRICFQPPRWRFSLESHAPIETDALPKIPDNKPRTPSARSRAMAFYPGIVGDFVLVADARFVVAYALHDGSFSVWYDAKRDMEGLDRLVALKLPAPADLRYSLTVADDRVYARMGVQDIGPDRGPDENLSSLVCLNVKPDDKGQRLRWQTTPDEAKPGAVYEGAPLVHDGRVYIAATRVEDGQTITAIHCYPADADAAPRALWRRDVCSTQELRKRERRYRHHLLTLAGSRVVYCSHSGAIVALNAETGHPEWAVRYPSRGGTTQAPEGVETPAALRDLAPCVHAAGRLYVAPNDHDRVLCLDAATGETVWESGGLQVTHLLGVARGKLLFTTRNTIRAVDALTGEHVWQMPDDDTFLTTQGRGLITDDLVFWPTSPRGMIALRLDDGLLAGDFPPGVLEAKMPSERMGNMAYADGCLAVAGPEELAVYLAPGRQRADREAEVKAQPHSPAARLGLAISEADAGLGQQALDSFRRTEELARSEQPTLADEARGMRHELLLELAAKCEAARQWNQAMLWLEAAAAIEFAPALRSQAKARLAGMCEQAGQASRAVAAWQDILDDPALRDSRLNDANGYPQHANTLAAAAMNRLTHNHGSGVYNAIEQRAQERFESGKKDRLEELRQLVKQFPNAAVTNTALWGLAQAEEKAGRMGAASHAYRTFLRRAPKASKAPLALASLARIYERERLWRLARTTWQELAATFGDLTVPALDPKQSVARFAASRIDSRAEFLPIDEDYASAVPLPLVRAWDIALELKEQLLVPDGAPVRGIPDEWLFFATPKDNGGRLTCRNSSSGKPQWTVVLPFAPSWIGCHADTLLAGGKEGLAGLHMADGHLLWHFPAAGSLSAFQVPGSRLFFLEDESRLYALDAETGETLWARWAPAAQLKLPEPSGRFNPHYFAGNNRLVVQTSAGRLWLLEAQTGRLIQDAAMSQRPWSQPPRAINDQGNIGDGFCVATEPHRIVRIDAATGKEVWRHELRHATSLTGELPQLLGDSGALAFLLIPRNYGTMLQRFDPRTGTALLNEERLLTTQSLAADQITFDTRALYFVANNVLHAHALGDGKTLWAMPLVGPSGRWRAQLAGPTLIVWPEAVHAMRAVAQVGGADIPVCLPLRQTGMSAPPAMRLALDSVEWVAADLSLRLPNAETERLTYPIAFVDPQTGQPVQRLNFPLDSPRAVARKMPQGERGPRVREQAPVFHISRNGMIVAVPGRASRLVTLKEGD